MQLAEINKIKIHDFVVVIIVTNGEYNLVVLKCACDIRTVYVYELSTERRFLWTGTYSHRHRLNHSRMICRHWERVVGVVIRVHGLVREWKKEKGEEARADLLS